MTQPAVTESFRIPRQPQPAGHSPARRLGWMITAGAAAVSLLLATAIPARADRQSDDLAKALAALVVIGAIVNEAGKDDGRRGPHSVPRPAPEPTRHKKDGKRIPAVCAIQFEGERRNVTVYPERCLIRQGVTRRLPRDCAHEARILGKWDRVYGERCLREAGFSLPGDRNRRHDRWDDRDYYRDLEH